MNNDAAFTCEAFDPGHINCGHTNNYCKVKVDACLIAD